MLFLKDFSLTTLSCLWRDGTLWYRITLDNLFELRGVIPCLVIPPAGRPLVHECLCTVR